MRAKQKSRSGRAVFLSNHYNVYIIMIFLFSKHNNLKVFKNNNFKVILIVR